MEPELIKIVMVGDSGVGKSSLLLRYVEDSFTEFFISGTTGVDYKRKKVVIDGKELNVELWDTAGQERFRTITTSYYRGAKGVVLVYDVGDPLSFNNATQWLVEIERYALQKPVKLLVGNKCDLQSKKQVKNEEGTEFADYYQLPFLETSAKDGTNVEKAFDILLKRILLQLDAMNAAEREERGSNDTRVQVDQNNITTQNKSDDKKPKRRCDICYLKFFS